MTKALPLKPGQTYAFNTFASDHPQAITVETGNGHRAPLQAERTTSGRHVDRKVWKTDQRGDEHHAPEQPPPSGSMTKTTTSRRSIPFPGSASCTNT